MENLFSQLRFLGHNFHPSPVQAMGKMKMILIGTNPGNVIKNPSVENEDFAATGARMQVNMFHTTRPKINFYLEFATLSTLGNLFYF